MVLSESLRLESGEYDTIQNLTSRNELNISGLIKNRRLEWVGHAIRTNEGRWPVERRSVGRLRKRWTDGVQEDLQMMQTRQNWQRVAEDW